jgi:hypothetical protein
MIENGLLDFSDVAFLNLTLIPLAESEFFGIGMRNTFVRLPSNIQILRFHLHSPVVTIPNIPIISFIGNENLKHCILVNDAYQQYSAVWSRMPSDIVRDVARNE